MARRPRHSLLLHRIPWPRSGVGSRKTASRPRASHLLGIGSDSASPSARRMRSLEQNLRSSSTAPRVGRRFALFSILSLPTSLRTLPLSIPLSRESAWLYRCVSRTESCRSAFPASRVALLRLCLCLGTSGQETFLRGQRSQPLVRPLLLRFACRTCMVCPP